MQSYPCQSAICCTSLPLCPSTSCIRKLLRAPVGCPLSPSVITMSLRHADGKQMRSKGPRFMGMSHACSWEKYVVVGKGYAKTDAEDSMKMRGELFEVSSPGILPASTP